MKSRSRSLAATLALTPVALLLAAPVMADDTGFYVGANIGRVLSSYKRKDIDNSVTDIFSSQTTGFALGPTSVNKDHVMWSADVGYMFDRNFGLEASYLHLGSLHYTSFGTQPTSDGSSTELDRVNIDVKSAGPALAAIAALPLFNTWQIDARAGAYQGKTTSTYYSAVGSKASSGRASKTTTSLLVGAGTAVTVTTHCVVRLDYLRLQHLDDTALSKSFHVDLLTLGAAYIF